MSSWSHDYCLYCDKQTTEGAYCSQACRVADLEKSEPASPLQFPLNSSSSSSSQSSTLYRTSSSARLESSPSTPRTLNSQYGYFTGASSTSGYIQQPKRLSTSSSRSSLSSVGSYTHGMADHTYTQLRDFSNSFDQVRDYKRRGGR